MGPPRWTGRRLAEGKLVTKGSSGEDPGRGHGTQSCPHPATPCLGQPCARGRAIYMWPDPQACGSTVVPSCAWTRVPGTKGPKKQPQGSLPWASVDGFSTGHTGVPALPSSPYGSHTDKPEMSPQAARTRRSRHGARGTPGCPTLLGPLQGEASFPPARHLMGVGCYPEGAPPRGPSSGTFWLCLRR